MLFQTRYNIQLVILLSIISTKLFHQKHKNNYYASMTIHILGLFISTTYLYYCYINYSDNYINYLNISLATSILSFHIFDMIEEKNLCEIKN